MTRRILCVDDEPNVLQAFERQFRKRFELQTALGPERALEAIATGGPFAVVVSDLRMPGMDGITFLTRVREKAPDSVRIILTGQADLDTAIAAVNQGNVFQFLTKPCPPEMLARALDAGLEHHRLIVSERELLEETLRGSIGMMSEILSLVNPVAFSRAERIRVYVLHIAERLKLAATWQFELSAMLSQIGCVAVPPDVLEKHYEGQALDTAEQTVLASQWHVGQKLLAKIPRLEDVAEMIGNQAMAQIPSGTGTVSIGSRLLKVALDFDELVTRGAEPSYALALMRKRAAYDVRHLSALEQVQTQEAQRKLRLISLAELKAGMTTNTGVYSKSGLLLMGAGQEITASAIARLQTFALTKGVAEPISVLMPLNR